MPVALRCETGRGRSYATGLRADARRLMALVGLAACELSIVIADDRFVRALNREFRGKDRPTDVLSFSQLEQERPPKASPSRTSGTARAPGGGARRRRNFGGYCAPPGAPPWRYAGDADAHAAGAWIAASAGLRPRALVRRRAADVRARARTGRRTSADEAESAPRAARRQSSRRAARLKKDDHASA